MSRSAIWIASSIVISLLMIAALYTSVSVAHLGVTGTSVHQISAARMNFVHYRGRSDFGALNSPSLYPQSGHGCGADPTSSPDD